MEEETTNSSSLLAGTTVRTEVYAITWEKLSTRQIYEHASEDKRSKHFKAALDVKPLCIRFEQIKGLQSILTDFVHKCEQAPPHHNSCDAIEEFSNTLNRWRTTLGLASTTNRDFDLDIRLCKQANEAVLQRTLLTNIIDRWQLPALFSYNCEGQWFLPDTFRLPSRLPNKISLPKPDLAVFFTKTALTGPDMWSPVPEKIDNCLRPDGGNDRWFPFLFMEAKKAMDSLDRAYMVNMYTASQALLNIYSWMKYAGQEDTFFDQVRVFSVVLNAEVISLRSHRAARLENGSLSYHFDDILSFNPYNRDQSCLLVRNILIEYGQKELHAILKTAFKKVSQEAERLAKQADMHLQRQR